MRPIFFGERLDGPRLSPPRRSPFSRPRRYHAPMLTLIAALVFTLPIQASGDLDVINGELTTLAKPPGALPGEVLAFGEKAFAIASSTQTANARAVVAGTRAGKGRAVAFGHDAFFGGAPDSQSLLFLGNCLVWTGDQPLAKLEVLVLGPALQTLEGLVGKATASAELPASLSGFDTILWRSGDPGAEDVERLIDYVKRGGGLVFGVCPWGRQQLYGDSGRSIRTDLPHNQVAQALGLAFGFDTVGDDSLTLVATANQAVHAGRAIDAAIAVLTDKSPKADAPPQANIARLTGAILRALPPGDPRVAARLSKALGKLDLSKHVPRPGRPIASDDTQSRLAITLATETLKEADPADIPAAPGFEFFPGAVDKGTRPVTRTLTFEPSRIDAGAWLSTGLYARAGEPITITTASAANWDVRIGAHSDTLWHLDSWKRWPEITQQHPLPREGDSRHASPFGGLVYLVPRNGADPKASFIVDGAVQATHYRHGDAASLENWKARRQAGAPWAELECDGVIFTLTQDVMLKLDDPAALMDYWTTAMNCYPELLGKPLHPTGRPERLVEDIQISAGWMHSGYPVMSHGADSKAYSEAADLELLTTKGDWGYFHEFGHNAQDSRWTFSGTGEVTNNLFSLYLGDRMAGITPWNNPWLENQKDQLAPYLKQGAPFDQWKQKPGLALLTFALVQREFGWEPFKTVLASYTPDVKLPNDESKRDAWLVRLSNATGRNLGPYFERFGIPVSDAARAQVAELEPWMPDELKP